MSLIAESSSALTLLPVSADLNIATKETFFMFNTKCYWQIDGVAIGSPLGPDFMWSFESKWLRYCPNDSKPVFYIRFIDDIFVLFSSPDQADKFRKYLSSKHPDIKIFKVIKVILKSERVNTWEYLHSLGKELKLMMILPIKNILYSAVTHLILMVIQFLQPTTMTLKSR